MSNQPTYNPQSIPLADLEGRSGSTAKFEALGDTHAGKIVQVIHAQQTDIDQKPMTWPNGQPRMQWIITLAKTGGDQVNLYCRGGSFTPEQGEGDSMLAAVSAAVRKAGADSLDVGAELGVQFSGLGKPEVGKSAPKLFKAEYRPGTKAVSLDIFQ